MSSLKAQQLLLNAATIYFDERQTLPKVDILKRIQEIKYLSSQKKIPKLSLRKEILQLEQQLQRTFKIEAKLQFRGNQESLQIASLRSQISQLKHRLVLTEDRDLHRKVEKLSCLLGDCLAQKNAAEQAMLQANALQEQQPEQQKNLLETLQERLEVLKTQLEEKEDISLTRRQQLETKIDLLEEKVKELRLEETKKNTVFDTTLPENIMPEKKEVKHTLIFHSPPPQRKD